MAEIRKDHGDTQAALAQKLGVSTPAVRSWEQDKNSPGHDMLVKICRLYDTTSDYLLGLSDSDPIFAKRTNEERLTPGELAELKAYESYLIWKRSRIK